MTSDKKYPVLVLAGRRNGDDPVAATKGVACKAIASIAGKPMIARVLAALTESLYTGAIYVSAQDPNAFRKDLADAAVLSGVKVLAAGHSICQSIRQAVMSGDLQPPFLVITADHALLTPAMLNHFRRAIDDAPQQPAPDFALAFVARATIKAAYPNSRRTYLQFRDDGYSGCNMFAFLTPRALRVLDFWQDVEQKRKKPLELVRAFGIGNLIRYVLRLHDLDGMIARGGKIVGVRALAVKMPWAEAAMDVDSPRDVEIAEAILVARETNKEKP